MTVVPLLPLNTRLVSGMFSSNIMGIILLRKTRAKALPAVDYRVTSRWFEQCNFSALVLYTRRLWLHLYGPVVPFRIFNKQILLSTTYYVSSCWYISTIVDPRWLPWFEWAMAFMISFQMGGLSRPICGRSAYPPCQRTAVFSQIELSTSRSTSIVALLNLFL